MSFVVVLPVPHWSLKKYVDAEKLPAALSDKLFCATSELFTAVGANFKFDSRAKFDSIHAQTSVLGATLKGFVLGVAGGGMQGDPRQQGAAFVLRCHATSGAQQTSGGVGAEAVDGCGHAEQPPPIATAALTWTTVWAHKDRHNADQVPIPVLLAAAGLPSHVYKHPR